MRFPGKASSFYLGTAGGWGVFPALVLGLVTTQEAVSSPQR